jgi:hypothetical protein
MIKERRRIAILLRKYFDQLRRSLSDHSEFFERALRRHEERRQPDPEAAPPRNDMR